MHLLEHFLTLCHLDDSHRQLHASLQLSRLSQPVSFDIRFYLLQNFLCESESFDEEIRKSRDCVYQ